jgi:hypothetical protein
VTISLLASTSFKMVNFSIGNGLTDGWSQKLLLMGVWLDTDIVLLSICNASVMSISRY